MTDAAFQQEHGAGLEVMAGSLSQAESLIRLGETMREAFGPDMPDSVLAALGYVALQLREARAGESRWHAEARESTRLLHFANAKHAEALADALLFAAESDERGAVLASIARAVALTEEAPAARRARLLAALADSGSLRRA